MRIFSAAIAFDEGQTDNSLGQKQRTQQKRDLIYLSSLADFRWDVRVQTR